MANVRISQLPSLSTLQAADLFPVVDTNTTYNITAANIQTFMLSTAGNVTSQMYLGNAYTNPKSYQSNVSVLGNVNGFLQGLITVGSAYNLYVPDSSTLSVLTSYDGLGSSSGSGGGGGNSGGGGGGTSFTNVAVSGYLSATGNIYAQTFSATANIIGGNLSLTGNVSSNLQVSGGVLSVVGNVVVTQAVSVAGNVLAGNVSAKGNVIFGNASTTGNVYPGNVVFSTIGFAFQQQGGNLYLTYNGANIIAFNNNGTIVASNNITAYGTP
jgi:hypothetical protein